MNEVSIKKVHIGGTAGYSKKEDSNAIQPEVINSCDSHELSMVFLHSDKLDSEVGGVGGLGGYWEGSMTWPASVLGKVQVPTQPRPAL